LVKAWSCSFEREASERSASALASDAVGSLARTKGEPSDRLLATTTDRKWHLPWFVWEAGRSFGRHSVCCSCVSLLITPNVQVERLRGGASPADATLFGLINPLRPPRIRCRVSAPMLERILTRRLSSGRGPPLEPRPTNQNEVAAKRPQLVQDDAGQRRQRKHGLRLANSRCR